MKSEIVSDEGGGLLLKDVSTITDFSLDGIKFSPLASQLFNSCLEELHGNGIRELWIPMGVADEIRKSKI